MLLRDQLYLNIKLKPLTVKNFMKIISFKSLDFSELIKMETILIHIKKPKLCKSMNLNIFLHYLIKAILVLVKCIFR